MLHFLRGRRGGITFARTRARQGNATEERALLRAFDGVDQLAMAW